MFDEKEVHQNSIDAYHSLDRDTRRKHVLAVYQARPNEALTDRMVVKALGFEDMNQARPRITELCKSGMLVETGKVTDLLTGKKVRTLSFIK